MATHPIFKAVEALYAKMTIDGQVFVRKTNGSLIEYYIVDSDDIEENDVVLALEEVLNNQRAAKSCWESLLKTDLTRGYVNGSMDSESNQSTSKEQLEPTEMIVVSSCLFILI